MRDGDSSCGLSKQQLCLMFGCEGGASGDGDGLGCRTSNCVITLSCYKDNYQAWNGTISTHEKLLAFNIQFRTDLGLHGKVQ